MINDLAQNIRLMLRMRDLFKNSYYGQPKAFDIERKCEFFKATFLLTILGCCNFAKLFAIFQSSIINLRMRVYSLSFPFCHSFQPLVSSKAYFLKVSDFIRL